MKAIKTPELKTVYYGTAEEKNDYCQEETADWQCMENMPIFSKRFYRWSPMPYFGIEHPVEIYTEEAPAVIVLD